MALDLAVTGMQALRLQGKSRGGYRLKAGSSYVDETLFGSPSNASRVELADFDPPWAEKRSTQKPLLWSPSATGMSKETGTPKSNSPASTPRKSYKYRVKSRSPSFCDETLFGPRLQDPGWDAPWVKKEDTLKLRPLLWTPPSAPRVQSSRPTHGKQCPLKAIHPEMLQSPAVDFETEYKGKADFWTRPESEAGSTTRSESQTQTRPRAHSGSPPSGEKHWQRASQSAADAAGTNSSPRGVSRPRSASFSGLDFVRKTAAKGIQAPKPPWK